MVMVEFSPENKLKSIVPLARCLAGSTTYNPAQKEPDLSAIYQAGLRAAFGKGIVHVGVAEKGVIHVLHVDSSFIEKLYSAGKTLPITSALRQQAPDEIQKIGITCKLISQGIPVDESMLVGIFSQLNWSRCSIGFAKRIWLFDAATNSAATAAHLAIASLESRLKTLDFSGETRYLASKRNSTTSKFSLRKYCMEKFDLVAQVLKTGSPLTKVQMNALKDVRGLLKPDIVPDQAQPSPWTLSFVVQPVKDSPTTFLGNNGLVFKFQQQPFLPKTKKGKTPKFLFLTLSSTAENSSLVTGSLAKSWYRQAYEKGTKQMTSPVAISEFPDLVNRFEALEILESSENPDLGSVPIKSVETFCEPMEDIQVDPCIAEKCHE